MKTKVEAVAAAYILEPANTKSCAARKFVSTALQRLLNLPKGLTTYTSGQTFLVHVFWEAPSRPAADTLLSALTICARETHHNTPCVPTYAFRISKIADDITSPAPKRLCDHLQLASAFRRLKVGTPFPAVAADMARRGFYPKLLELDPLADMPAQLQQKPVMLKFTEVYLDDKAFMEHVGSQKYLDAYAQIMTPGLQNSQTTIRLGTPVQKTIDTILAPMLKEVVIPLADGCTIYNITAGQLHLTSTCPILLSLDASKTGVLLA